MYLQKRLQENMTTQLNMIKYVHLLTHMCERVYPRTYTGTLNKICKHFQTVVRISLLSRSRRNALRVSHV